MEELALGKAGEGRIESRKDAKNAKVMNQKQGILSFFCFYGLFSPSFQILFILCNLSCRSLQAKRDPC